MRICYLDAFSGISGDMLVGALADAGADSSAIVDALQSLAAGASVSFEKVKRCGIAASKFRVSAEENPKHRHLSGILKMIEGASLPGRVKQNASAVFQRLGEAEAAVHQTPIEKVHFHEVGALDSIADIVGACLGFELLSVDTIYCSPLNLGSGTALAKDFGPMPSMRIARIGYGAGDRDFAEQANVLRIFVGEPSGAAEAASVVVIEANIDDSSPQVLGYTVERLLEAGALDATLQPLEMKKGRPGALLRVISTLEQRTVLANIIFHETTTLGVRLYTAERIVQARHSVEVETPHGKVRMKVSDHSFAPEYEDCRALARATGAALKDIIAEAYFAYLKNSR